ncbi:AMP-binding protein [Streptomyces sp. TP-A0874]|uniref:AMP-binding protein n=1 Tax=Streptomyces sp. TP-A0874 TaxID=549819 RepID=UPI000852CD9E|nr:AMP-binding protein [Streptomyces sp. TP-A0874]
MRLPTSADLLFGQLNAAGAEDRRPWGVDHGSAAVEVRDGAVRLADVAGAARSLALAVTAEGLAEGERCVVRLEEPLDILVAVAGLTAAGVVPVLLSPRMDSVTASAALAPVPGPLHALASKQFAGEPLESGGGLRLGWEELAARGAPREDGHLPEHGVELPADSPYLVTHTSGTTGVPKLAVHTRSSFFQQAAVQVRMMRPMRLRGYLAAAISPVHVRTLSGLLGALRLRHSVLMLASEEPAVVGEQLERWRPAYLETHPNSFVTWEGLADSGAFSSVRMFLGTFDAMHPRVTAALLAGSRRFLPTFTEVYAQSELGPIAFRVSMRKKAAERRRIGADLAGHRLGVAIPGYSRLRVVDDTGKVLPRGTAGRIQVRSRGRFAGYLNFPEKFGQNLSPDGWWDSGDWGVLGRAGGLRLLDRQVERMDAVPSGIALEDVLLSRVPELVEAVILEQEGALLPVVVTGDARPLPQDRWASAVHDLPPLAPPRFMGWDDIPRTATGKVRREVLLSRLTA